MAWSNGTVKSVTFLLPTGKERHRLSHFRLMARPVPRIVRITDALLHHVPLAMDGSLVCTFDWLSCSLYELRYRRRQA